MLATLKDLRKTRRQLISFLGASLLMISSGIYMSHGLFNPSTLLRLPVTENYHNGLVILVIASWHLGGISGFIAAPYYLTTFSKKTIYVSIRENNKFLLPFFVDGFKAWVIFYKFKTGCLDLRRKSFELFKIFLALVFDGNDKSFAISPLV